MAFLKIKKGNFVLSFKILIVDDSETTRISIKNTLGKEYITKEAENGFKALEVLDKENDFDLIILDLNMPKLDGLGFIKIQAEKEIIKKIPIIMCTTETSFELKSKVKETGIVKAWLIKPLVSKVLLRAVNRVLDSNQQVS